MGEGGRSGMRETFCCEHCLASLRWKGERGYFIDSPLWRGRKLGTSPKGTLIAPFHCRVNANLLLNGLRLLSFSAVLLDDIPCGIFITRRSASLVVWFCGL
jgi:hypothetical protein